LSFHIRCRVLAAVSVALLGSTLASPAAAASSVLAQSAVVLLMLADGTACRGPITGTTFNLIDQRANYACTDGRWILGEPFTLGDGRQVALLGRTIVQGQLASDDADPCQQPTCVVGLQQVEVATWASLPSEVFLEGGNPRIGSYGRCTFQDGQTFFVGTTRANYVCDSTYWRKLKDARQDLEYWILGGPMYMSDGSGFPTVIFATVVRQNGPLMNVPSPVCEQPVCVLTIQQMSITR
jgi:hypothetical protein